jgi:hypothetical protein
VKATKLVHWLTYCKCDVLGFMLTNLAAEFLLEYTTVPEVPHLGKAAVLYHEHIKLLLT